MAVTFIFALSGQAFAESADYLNIPMETVSTFSEYDWLQSVEEKSDFELKDDGYTDEQIECIKTGTYEEELKNEVFKCSKLDEKTLEDMGYTQEQILGLKSLQDDESIQQLAVFSASVKCKNWLSSHVYDKKTKKTKFNINYSWEWTALPLIAMSDCIGMGWNNNFGANVNSNTVKVIYKPLTDCAKTVEKTYKVVEKEMGIAQAQFPMKCDNQHWARSGSGIMKLTAAGLKKNTKFQFKYAHNQLGATPSVTIPAGIGFTFKSAEDIFMPDAVVYSETSK